MLRMKKLIFLFVILLTASCTKDPIIYTLTTSTNPADGGSISPPTSKYEAGETVDIVASPNSDYLFKNWSLIRSLLIERTSTFLG